MAGLRPAASIHPGLLSAWHGIAFCHVPADEPARLERLTSDGSDRRPVRGRN
jgi:hypothetical protein